jgi:hypothetical protein
VSTGPRRAVFFDVENGSRFEQISSLLRALGLPNGGSTQVFAMGNWRVIGLETARLLAHSGATLIHTAPKGGVKDWSDLRIAVEAGRWLGQARADDVLEIVSDDQAFDAVGDAAATSGIVFRRISARRRPAATSSTRSAHRPASRRAPRAAPRSADRARTT